MTEKAPNKHRNPWTQKDEKELRRLYQSDAVLLCDVPGLLGRTYHATRQHARRLGLTRWYGRPNKNTHFKCSVHGWVHPKDLRVNVSDRVVCPLCGKRVKGKAQIPVELKLYGC